MSRRRHRRHRGARRQSWIGPITYPYYGYPYYDDYLWRRGDEQTSPQIIVLKNDDNRSHLMWLGAAAIIALLLRK